jgi:hypothetical protein
MKQSRNRKLSKNSLKIPFQLNKASTMAFSISSQSASHHLRVVRAWGIFTRDVSHTWFFTAPLRKMRTEGS